MVLFDILENFIPILETNIELQSNLKKYDDIVHISNYLFYCHKNGIACHIILDNAILSEQFNKQDHTNTGIYIYFFDKYIYLDWDSIHEINKFFSKKINHNNISIELTDNWFNIFFIAFYYNNIDKFTGKSSIKLIGNNSLFGIYHTYNDIVINSVSNLYFSFIIGNFVLHNAVENGNYIKGILLPWITYSKTDNKILYNKQYFTCPRTFIHIKDDKYGIKKREILTIKPYYKLKPTQLSNVSKIFYNKLKSDMILIIKLKEDIDDKTLQHLYTHIVSQYSDLKQVSSQYYYNVDKYHNKNNFALYTKKNDIRALYIHMDYCLTPLIPNILWSINKLLNTNDELDNKLDTDLEIEPIQDVDKHIHIVSEIYYFIILILIYLPKFIINIRSIDEGDVYNKIHYTFTETEVDRLWLNKSDMFSENNNYLKAILMKTMSVFLEKHYVIFMETNNIDILPVYSNMSNSSILNLLNRNEKARYTKGFLLSLMGKLIEKLDVNSEYPLIIVNLLEIPRYTNYTIERCNTNNKTGQIPIVIDVCYNLKQLNISICYKKRYGRLKYIFNEFINQLVSIDN